MADVEDRLEQLEKNVEELSSDLEMLRTLVRANHQSALNKMRYVTEKVLHRLCVDHGVTWGASEPTLENVIGPLSAKRVIPKNVVIHVRTVQTNTSPGSHFQETPLGATHVQVAQMALLDFLEWDQRQRSGQAETAAPRASSERRPVVAAAPSKAPSRRMLFGVLAAGALVLTGGLVATASRRSQPPPPPSPSTQAANGVASASSAPALVEPEVGLSTIGQFRDPTMTISTNLRTTTAWRVAADSFAAACAQPGAPARWCAGKAFAEGQMALVSNQDDAAEKAFHEAFALDPTWALPQVGLATIFTRAKDLEKALDASVKAQELDPKWWGAVAVGARAYSALGKREESISEYRRAVALAPKNPMLLAEVALAYHAAEMDAEADRIAAEALALDPELVHVRVMYAERALEKNDGKRALEEADKALAVSPRHIPALLARADALTMLRRNDDAKAAYRKLLELRAELGGDLEPRLSLVQSSLAKNELPPPRSSAPGHATRSAPRPACKCQPGDPLCSCL